jgi:hypothetical protein
VSDWVCGRCKSINRERAAACYSCGGIRGAIQLDTGGAVATPASAMGSRAVPAGPEAAAAPAAAASLATATLASGIPVAEVTAPAPAEPATMGDLVGGVIGGAIGAVLATAIWYGVVTVTHWQIGFVAVAVGFIVAQGVVFGAGRHPSILLVPVSLAFTFAALVVSEYFIATFLINEGLADLQSALGTTEFEEMGFTYAELQAYFGAMSPLEVVRSSLESDPLTLLFWAIAGWEAFVIPMRAATRSNA